ncbi:hypothetical protein [Cesiribacter sp. SM1]|uniref:hypothetical protein n=1 Tax=Cesiribacter sp. SM1 TaxID=2861196 RepID=UPI001CD6130C|nr:hypothetical protein [Cesiribacter sp. SM1]
MRSLKVSEAVDLEIQQWKLFFQQRNKLKISKGQVVEMALRRMKLDLNSRKEDKQDAPSNS